MITIFNRRELAFTYKMEEQSRNRQLLSTNNINYKLKVFNRNNSSAAFSGRGRTIPYGYNTDLQYEYTFYVHKNNFDLAMAVINGTFSK